MEDAEAPPEHTGADAARYRVLALSELDTVPTPAGLRWRPVRGALGIRTFGVGGYFAARAGQDVVEPHRESDEGRGQQELYIVVRGTAEFMLDGERFEAPTGTLVFVADPAVQRHAVALEDSTEVLALGGEPVFQPAGGEWIWRVRALLPEQIDQARALLAQGERELPPDSPGLLYSRALVARAAHERDQEAREWLAQALERAPELRRELELDRLPEPGS